MLLLHLLNQFLALLPKEASEQERRLDVRKQQPKRKAVQVQSNSVDLRSLPLLALLLSKENVQAEPIRKPKMETMNKKMNTKMSLTTKMMTRILQRGAELELQKQNLFLEEIKADLPLPTLPSALGGMQLKLQLLSLRYRALLEDLVLELVEDWVETKMKVMMVGKPYLQNC